MNTLHIALLSIILFWLGYQFYGRSFEKLWGLKPFHETPAVKHYDGVDYVPVKHWTVLFGHHFSSIAGAGPIVGPIIALCLWGWLPSVLWIVLGAILIGGIHDFSALMVSLRHDGTSIADVAKTVISRRAKVIFSLFIWLALILVIAVFIYFCADTFMADQRIVVPSLGLIPLAMLIGFLLYDLKFNLVSTTILGLVLFFGLIILGYNFPVEAVKLTFKVKAFTVSVGPMQIWSMVLLVYCFFASIAPVHILLQPRDYLSAFLLVVGIIFGLAGIIITHPVMQLPAYVGWEAQAGPLWPMLLVTVACGAISGFHALIASGTSSKQLANERDARKIGYGAMLVEGLLAILAILIVGGTMTHLELQEILRPEAGGPVTAFGQGFAQVTKPFLKGFGGLLAITIVNAFILTTLDTATRIARYITQELLGLKNRYIATLIVVIFGGVLALSGSWRKIWPIFGAANQLVAAFTLIVVTAWLLAKGKGKGIKFTLLPSLIMLATSIGALLLQIINCVQEKNFVLLFISLALMGLALYLLLEIDIILLQALKQRREKQVKQDNA